MEHDDQVVDDMEHDDQEAVYLDQPVDLISRKKKFLGLLAQMLHSSGNFAFKARQ
jgi:hypothetical protein